MAFKVLVVDDSNFFQRRLQEIINEHPELEVVGVAENGREAIRMADELRPDIISMDYEMPVMDGITAVSAIMANKPVPILMFSSMTYEGAKITLDALAAGAVDFIPKDFAEVSRNSKQLKAKLHSRLLDIIHSQEKLDTVISAGSSLSAKPSSVNDDSQLKEKIEIVVIGASTGGPVALTEIIKNLPEKFPLPIVLIQHMPENFTKAFAERLDLQGKVNVKQAEDGDRLRAGTVLLAPGGKQLIVDTRDKYRVKIISGDDRINYRPSVDITFASVANSYGEGCLGIVLTGMGSDGCEGARLLKQKKSTIWTQDEKTSVIYGMPMVVANANLSDKVVSLPEIVPKLESIFC